VTIDYCDGTSIYLWKLLTYNYMEKPSIRNVPPLQLDGFHHPTNIHQILTQVSRRRLLVFYWTMRSDDSRTDQNRKAPTFDDPINGARLDSAAGLLYLAFSRRHFDAVDSGHSGQCHVVIRSAVEVGQHPPVTLRSNECASSTSSFSSQHDIADVNCRSYLNELLCHLVLYLDDR